MSVAQFVVAFWGVLRFIEVYADILAGDMMEYAANFTDDEDI